MGATLQMTVTTHETQLLDLDLLRRDESWLMEKDRHQQSKLSSLGDCKPRKDPRIEKGYPQGRSGGIPFIGDRARNPVHQLLGVPVGAEPRTRRLHSRD